MELSEVKHADFRENGFMVVRNVLAADEVATLRQRADEIIREIDDYQQRDTAERQRLAELHRQEGHVAAARSQDYVEMPEERIVGRYARRGDRVYPARQHPVDAAARGRGKGVRQPLESIRGHDQPSGR